ncbi:MULTISPECIES: hypothetical protein [Actinomycetes]|uniref:hypothetical protein n=1 Tax=Actinomycetes TaxID=1760 RepID=UPI00068C5601|nr:MULTISPECIES: hypothetical protein [Actinomycetes]
MTQHDRLIRAETARPWRGLLAVAAVCAVALLVAGCGSDHEQPAPAPSPVGHDAHDHLPSAPTPQTAAASVVASQALATMFTWQPVTEDDSRQALQRAAPWLGGTLAAGTPTSLGSTGQPDPRWASWRRRGDVVIAAADVGPARTPDTSSTAARSVTVRQHVLHTDGTSTPLAPTHIHATLTRTPTGWRLTDYTVLAG